jgi:hypothetical protein
MDDNGDGPEKIKGFSASPIAQAPNQASGRFAMFPLWAANARLTKTARRVYDAISGSASGSWGKERHVRLSLKRIADLTGIPRHKIPPAIAELEKIGLLRKQRQRTEHGGFDTTIYILINQKGGVPSTGNRCSLAGEQVFPAQVVPEKGTIHREEETRRFRSPKRENGGGAFADPVKKALFEAGLLLLGKLQLPEDRARRLIGRWCKQVHDDHRLLGLILDARRADPVEPIAYMASLIARDAKQSEFGDGYRPMPSAAGG